MKYRSRGGSSAVRNGDDIFAAKPRGHIKSTSSQLNSMNLDELEHAGHMYATQDTASK